MSGGRSDAAPWLVAACAALTLSGISALAQSPKVTPSVALASAAAPAPPPVMDDGDGDELLEHWGDARYSREQRVQLAGLALFFGGAAFLSRRRRTARRRAYREG